MPLRAYRFSRQWHKSHESATRTPPERTPRAPLVRCLSTHAPARGPRGPSSSRTGVWVPLLARCSCQGHSVEHVGQTRHHSTDADDRETRDEMRPGRNRSGMKRSIGWPRTRAAGMPNIPSAARLNRITRCPASIEMTASIAEPTMAASRSWLSRSNRSECLRSMPREIGPAVREAPSRAASESGSPAVGAKPGRWLPHDSALPTARLRVRLCRSERSEL